MPVVIQFNSEEIIQRFEERNGLATAALCQQILKDSNFYCPLDQGTLQSSALISSDDDRGVITWNTPYAARLYYGIDFNFDKASNPNAQAMWFHKAKDVHVDEWVTVYKNVLERGD